MKTALMASLIFIMGAKCNTYGRGKKEFSKEENNWGLNERSRNRKECGSVLCNSASVTCERISN